MDNTFTELDFLTMVRDAQIALIQAGQLMNPPVIPIPPEIPWQGQNALGIENSLIRLHVFCGKVYELIVTDPDSDPTPPSPFPYYSRLYGEAETDKEILYPIKDSSDFDDFGGYAVPGAVDVMTELINIKAKKLAADMGWTEIEDILRIHENWKIVTENQGRVVEFRSLDTTVDKQIVYRWEVRPAPFAVCYVSKWDKMTNSGAIYKIQTTTVLSALMTNPSLNILTILTKIMNKEADLTIRNDIENLLNISAIASTKVLSLPQPTPLASITQPVEERLRNIATFRVDGKTTGRFQGATQLLAAVREPEFQVRRAYAVDGNLPCLCQIFKDAFPWVVKKENDTHMWVVCVNCQQTHRIRKG